MTIIDDLKAINKDIANEKDLIIKTNKANYWYVKLQNIYPDYNFTILYAGNYPYKILAGVKGTVL